MTAAWNARWLNQQLSRWTNGLKTVMLDGHGLASQKSKYKRGESGASQMNNIRRTDLLPQLTNAGLAENTKGKQVIVEVFGRRLRDNSDFKFRRVGFGLELGKPPSD
jgi:hypothetical protein